MDNFDLRKYLAEGKLYEEAYNLPDSDSTTDQYVNNHWDGILKDILRAHTDLRNSKGGESIPEKPSQLDIDIVLGRFDGADEFTDVDPNVYDEYFDFYDMYLVTQRDEENTKSISDEDYPKGNYDGYTKRDDLPKLAEGRLFENTINQISSRIVKLGKEAGISSDDIEEYVDGLESSFEPDAYKNITDKELLKDLKLAVKNLAEGKLYKDDVWYIEASEDSADIEQAGPKYKEAVINIIKAKHPDISGEDLEQSIEVTNSFWYDEARNNAKGSEPEEIEVSAEEFANSSIEYYEDALM